MSNTTFFTGATADSDRLEFSRKLSPVDRSVYTGRYGATVDPLPYSLWVSRDGGDKYRLAGQYYGAILAFYAGIKYRRAVHRYNKVNIVWFVVDSFDDSVVDFNRVWRAVRPTRSMSFFLALDGYVSERSRRLVDPYHDLGGVDPFGFSKSSRHISHHPELVRDLHSFDHQQESHHVS